MSDTRVERRPPPLPASIAGLAGFALLVAIVAAIGGIGSADAGEDYAALELPDWAPPNEVFSPVWAVLYVSIAVSGWLVWRVAGRHSALIPYAAQLVLNAIWPLLFFGANVYGLAAIEIGLLWLAIGATVVAFWRVHRAAALLLVPYWLWTTYAAALTVAVWRLN